MDVEKDGDLIQFVQYYFNLDFKEAMQKINYDFNLGLNLKTKLSAEQLKKIEDECNKRRMKKEYINKTLDFGLNNICSNLIEIGKIKEKIKKTINYINWEYKELEIAKLEQEEYILEEQYKEMIELKMKSRYM